MNPAMTDKKRSFRWIAAVALCVIIWLTLHVAEQFIGFFGASIIAVVMLVVGAAILLARREI
jgi:hypothetical protein